ncbi:Chaperone protein ClpB [Schaalia odontolytica]|uniref:Chaperone protein ClpB n=1 Tax=Schaalia odontolytica TaxID=1660 RepID=A0A2X0VRA9_9ACTO|nr:Chaperone protein ClpB [Schaalia odontolytica]
MDFRNTILILTSNLGSQFLADPDLTSEGKRDSVMSVVRAAFRPEFLNRLDEMVMFDPLTRENLGEIVDLIVMSVESRLRERRIGLTVTEPARGWLARLGYDPAFGARPLRRLIQREIGDRLAVLLLGGGLQDGHNVTVDINDSFDGLVMNVDKP